jgi:hypothetical protein
MDRFVESPYYNRNQEVARLWKLIREQVEELGIAAPGKERLFAKLFPEAAAYDDQRMRLLMSYLMKLAEAFLVQQEEGSDEVGFHTALASIYRKRRLPRHFDRAGRQARQSLERQPYRNADYYQDAYRLESEGHRFQASVNRMQEFNLQNIADSLDIVFISQKLRQACSMLSHQAVYKANYDFGLLEATLDHIKVGGLLQLPAISVYYYCYHALSQPEEPGHFKQFKASIFTWAEQFPPDEIRDLYILAINYCIQRYNAGASAYLDDEFELYKHGLDRGYLLSDGILSRFSYRNAVALGLVMKEYEWVERFIFDYKNALPPDHRESMFSFCMALLAYSRKDYNAAHELLQKSEYEDLLLNLAAKTVQIKIYFEWGETELLLAHLEAMRAFIRRKKVMGYHRENYLNSIHLTRRLLEVNPYDRQALQELRAAIEQTRPLAEKTWLLEQCAPRNDVML